MAPMILAVDDDPSILELLRYNFVKAEYRVLTAATGREALSILQTTEPDLTILDLMLPDLTGVEICRSFRQQSRAPVMILTARYNESDRVRALEAGADDYVTKPFSTRELMARAKAHLRRWSWQSTEPPVQDEEIVIGPLRLDVIGHRAFMDQKELHITPMEFAILKILCRAPGRVFPRERLLSLATGQEITGSARTIDVHIRSLRLKLEPDPTHPQFLETVRGGGYCFGRRIVPQPEVG